MSSVALIVGGAEITWPAVFAVLGVLSGALLSLGLWRLRRPAWELAVFFPAAVLFGLVGGRFMDWYSHPLQYASLSAAMTDFFRGGFSLSGVFAGALLAAALCRACGFTESLAAMGDALLPGAGLAIAVGRLGSLRDLSDRGKFTLKTPALQRLPFSAQTGGEWRFAVFYAQSLWALCLAIVLTGVFLFLYLKYGKDSRRREGTVTVLFALWYAVGQILLDSTRYDPDFFRFNGFIHVPQVLCALLAAGVTALLLVRSVRLKGGFRAVHGAIIGVSLGLLGVSGAMEYLVQRKAERYAVCYSVMGLCLALFALLGTALLLFPRGLGKKTARTAGKRPGKLDNEQDNAYT